MRVAFYTENGLDPITLSLEEDRKTPTRKKEVHMIADDIIKRFPKTMNYLADAEAREAVEGNHSRKMVERPKK